MCMCVLCVPNVCTCTHVCVNVTQILCVCLSTLLSNGSLGYIKEWHVGVATERSGMWVWL